VQTNLAGKTVLITDGVASLGKATALAFAREGANLLMAGTAGTDLLDQAAQEAQQLGVRVVTDRYNMGDQTQVRNLVQKALAEFGRLDIVVNNARSAPTMLSLQDIPFELWKTRIGEQVTGTLMLCQEALPGMIEQRWGRIINYIGLAAFLGNDAPNSAIELGLVGLSRGIAREYGKYNITANCIALAGIETGEEGGPFDYAPSDKDPLPRWGKPEEATFLAVGLASENAGYVTGQCLLANGGKYFL
jgi:3-oxoacyl-[acyl-carrier protein] reductase